MLGVKTRKYFNLNNIVAIAIIICIFCIINLHYMEQIYASTNHRILRENVNNKNEVRLNHFEFSMLFKNCIKKLNNDFKVIFVVRY